MRCGRERLRRASAWKSERSEERTVRDARCVQATRAMREPDTIRQHRGPGCRPRALALLIGFGTSKGYMIPRVSQRMSSTSSGGKFGAPESPGETEEDERTGRACLAVNHRVSKRIALQAIQGDPRPSSSLRRRDRARCRREPDEHARFCTDRRDRVRCGRARSRPYVGVKSRRRAPGRRDRRGSVLRFPARAGSDARPRRIIHAWKSAQSSAYARKVAAESDAYS